MINRRHARLSGLFYEDEIDITGLRHPVYDQIRLPPLCTVGTNDARNQLSRMDMLPEDVVHLLRSQLSTLYPSCAAAQVCLAGTDPAMDRYHVMELFGELLHCIMLVISGWLGS